jgi:hypothetical protein
MPEPQTRAATIEYMTTVLLGSNPGAGHADVLNNAAANGWQLVQIVERTVIFSRPLVTATERPTLKR